MRPYGQHFLHDKNILRKIIKLSEVVSGDRVLEIGPGYGALTTFLLEAGCQLLAVEIDSKLYDHLESEFSNSNFTLLKADALDSKHCLSDSLEQRLDSFDPYKLVSNLPYSAGVPILLNLWQSPHRPQEALVMLQKEVAQRIVASEGSKAYGAISILMRNVAESQIVADVSPQCFTPPPKVESSLLRMKSKPVEVDPKKLQQVVNMAFSQRRKQVGRLEKEGYDLKACGIDPKSRPEEIAPQIWFDLVRTVKFG